MEYSKEPEKYNLLQSRISMKNKMIIELNKMIRNMKNDLDLDKNELYNICSHKYERECTTSGCYAEYDWICKYCGKYR
jgi:hypothetical protein